jgi:uncharacterized protein (DUF697 family)
MSNHYHHHHHRHHRRGYGGYGGYNNYNSMDPDMDQDYDQGESNESEFNYESNYEMAPGFELNENEDEYGPSYESEGEGENELENVTNEQEFEHWVHGLARGYGNLHGILRHPLGRMAIRHFGRIAPAVVRGLGYRRGGWRGGYGGYGYGDRPYYNNRYWRHRGDLTIDTPPEPSPSYVDGSTPPAPTGDSTDNFRNFVLGTLQNLSQQVAAGNDTVNALKSAMANSAAANMPSIAQPAGDPSQQGGVDPSQQAGQAGTPPQAAQAAGAPQQGQAPQKEYERYGPYYGARSDGEITDKETSFGEATEMELASELLSVNNEQELDHFLGDLLKKAVGAVGGLLGGGSGGAGGILKNVLGGVVKKVLPLAGTAAGTFFGGPIGAAIGGNLGQMASGLFEMELEGLSNEDREFETARAVVRFAGNAARQLADNLTNDPREDVRRAVIEAAERFAPGLLVDDRPEHHHRHHHHNGHHHHHPGGEHHHSEHHHSGTWFRRGDKIIIENI